jgi:hypothetical protein
LFTHKTFFVRDVSFFHYPLKRLVTEAYSEGHWPLWNPYIQLGQPLLANPNAMALYPTQILFQLLPFELAFDLHFVLHCIVSGIATFFLARALGLSRHAAFLSAEVYNFSGVTLSFLNLFNILPVVAFLPLLSLALLKALRRFSLFKTACTSFLFGIFFLLLEPLSSLAVSLFLIPFLAWIFVFLPQPRMSFARGALLVVAMVASGVSLAAVQILPTLELIRYSGAGRDVIPLWVADTDFRAPPSVLEALEKRVKHGVFGYTIAPEELREAIVERLQRLYRWRIEPEWVVFLPGVVPGLHLAARHLLPASLLLVLAVMCSAPGNRSACGQFP